MTTELTEAKLRAGLASIAAETRPDIDAAWIRVQGGTALETPPSRPPSVLKTILAVGVAASLVLAVATGSVLLLRRGDDPRAVTTTTTDSTPPIGPIAPEPYIPSGVPEPYRARLADSVGLPLEVDRTVDPVCVHFEERAGVRTCTGWYAQTDVQYRAPDKTLISVQTINNLDAGRSTITEPAPRAPGSFPDEVNRSWVPIPGIEVSVRAMPGPYDIDGLLQHVVVEPMDTDDAWYLLSSPQQQSALYGDERVGGALCISRSYLAAVCNLVSATGEWAYTIVNTGNQGLLQAITPIGTERLVIETTGEPIDGRPASVDDGATAAVFDADLPPGTVVTRVVAFDGTGGAHDVSWQPDREVFPGQDPLAPGRLIPGGPVEVASQRLYERDGTTVTAGTNWTIGLDGTTTHGWSLTVDFRSGPTEGHGGGTTQPNAQPGAILVAGLNHGLAAAITDADAVRATVAIDGGPTLDVAVEAYAEIGLRGFVVALPDGATVVPAPRVTFYDAAGNETGFWPRF